MKGRMLLVASVVMSTCYRILYVPFISLIPMFMITFVTLTCMPSLVLHIPHAASVFITEPVLETPQVWMLSKNFLKSLMSVCHRKLNGQLFGQMGSPTFTARSCMMTIMMGWENGPGNIEINMAQVLMSFFGEPIDRDVAKTLGFRTTRALDAVSKGTDHHRSRQILKVLFDGLPRKLIVLHV